MPHAHITAEEMLAKLVSFPTVSDQTNLPLIDFVEDYLRSFGISSVKIFNAEGNKASLHAVVGPNVDGGVVLSAHTDVVPVEGQTWSSDPFVLTERGGRLYGRGTADMKGFAACALAHVPKFLEADLNAPIHIALSYDEEVGCFGAPPMIARMVAEGPRPMAVIVGEPTSMKVVTGHKGIMVFKTTITGHSVHASQLDRGVSAVSAAASLVGWLDEQTARNRANADPDCLYDPPYTTLHSGVIRGGTAHNITASTCELTSDIRFLPDEGAERWETAFRAFAEQEVLPDMKAVHPECAIKIERLASVPGLVRETDGAAEGLARRLTGDNSENVVVYATEGGQFQEHALSTVVCGPGSIDQAHQPDEFIESSQLIKCAAFLDALYKTLK